MKKLFAVLAAMMIAVLAVVPVSFASAGSATNAQVYVDTENGKTLNLRASASTSAAVLARLGVGKPLTLVKGGNDEWAKVTALVDGKNVTGYVMRCFVTADDPTNEPQTFVKVSSFKVTVAPSKGANGHVNLRAKASTSSTVLAYLTKGQTLTVTAESHAFYKVRTSAGQVGYVVKAFVNK